MAGQPPTASPGRPAAPATKTARQAQIVAILSREQVHSQERLAGLLAQYAGLHVAQATLSRDLDELGVVRLRGADGTLVYALPGDPGGPGSRPGTGLDPSNYPERTVAAPDRRPSPTPPRATRSQRVRQRGFTGSDADVGSSPGRATSAALGRRDAAVSTLTPHGGSSPPPRPSAQSAPGSGGAARRPDGDGRQRASGRQRPRSAPTLAAATGAATSADRPTNYRDRASARSAVSARFTRYLKELLTSAEGSANIVVLRTPAGAAQFLASTIDHAAWPAILGTVAVTPPSWSFRATQPAARPWRRSSASLAEGRR